MGNESGAVHERWDRSEPDGHEAMWELRTALSGYRSLADLVSGNCKAQSNDLDGVKADRLFNLLDVLNDNMEGVCDFVELTLDLADDVQIVHPQDADSNSH